MTDDHVCVPLVDGSGAVIGRVRVSPDLGVEGQRALVGLVEAAVRWQAERDAADPEGAAARQARWAAGQIRIRERNRRLRGEP